MVCASLRVYYGRAVFEGVSGFVDADDAEGAAGEVHGIANA